MRRFKFLQSNEDDLELELRETLIDITEETPDMFLEPEVYDYDYPSASWMWARDMIITQPYILTTVECNGIGEFLSLFPERFIVAVNSIESGGIEVTRDIDHNNIWPWDIQNSQLRIEYLRFEQ